MIAFSLLALLFISCAMFYLRQVDIYSEVSHEKIIKRA